MDLFLQVLILSALCLSVKTTYLPQPNKDANENEVEYATTSPEDDADYMDCMRERTTHVGEWRKCPVPESASEHDRKYIKCIRARDFCNSLVDCPNGEDEDMYNCFFYKMSELKLMEQLHITERKYDEKLAKLANSAHTALPTPEGPQVIFKSRKHLKSKRWIN